LGSSHRSYVSPVQGTCGLLQFIWAKPLFQIALISGYTNKTAAVVLSLVEPLLKRPHVVDDFQLHEGK